MREDKLKKEIEVFFQIILIVGAVFSFAYIVKEAFGAEILVSAQESGGLNDDGQTTSSANEDIELFNSFREEFPSLSDQNIRELMNEFDTPQEARESLTNLPGDIDNAIDSGSVSDALLAFLRFFSNFFPDITEIDGSQVEQQLFDFSGGGVWVCPEDKNEAICQAYLAKECNENTCPGGCIEIDISKGDLPDDSKCALGTCFIPEEGICTTGSRPGETRGGGSPKKACERFSGEWFPIGDSDGENLCSQGCCSFGDGQTDWMTEARCKKVLEDRGESLDSEGVGFDPSVAGQLACAALARLPEEGACVYPSQIEPGKNDCRFITDKECAETGGEFNRNELCSNPELNTNCERQNATSCIEGLDEVYWLDSCGNKENIFESDRDKGWNSGFVLPKNESCSLGDADNPLVNQATCGNCDRIRSSSCGEKIGENDLGPAQEIPGEEFVCRDLGCYQQNLFGGWDRIRENGESWCAYQSSIGLPGPDIQGADAFISFIPKNPVLDFIGLGGNTVRSTDTPGSRNFRVVCQDGEVVVNQCDDFRNSLCTEQQTPKGVDPSLIDPELLISDPEAFFQNIGSAAENIDFFAGTFSQASCRPNRWAECFAYNPNQMEAQLLSKTGPAASKILKAKLDLTCGQDPDCFVKSISIDKFDFSFCAPRYPPGFDLTNNAQEQNQDGSSGDTQNQQSDSFFDSVGGGILGGNNPAAEQICGQATQSCTAVFVKEEVALGLGGTKWVCKSNCECIDGDSPGSAKASKEFVQAMNSMCVSLGDCGSSVNYKGDLPGGRGFTILVDDCDGESDDPCIDKQNPGPGAYARGAFNLDIQSILGIGLVHIEDANPTPGEFIQTSGNFLNDVIGNFLDDAFANLGIDDFLNGLGIPGLGGGGGGSSGFNGGFDSGTGYGLAGVSGATGGAVYSIAYLTTTEGTTATVGSLAETAVVLKGTALSEGLTPVVPAPIAGFTTALVGAAIGLAVTTFLIDITGIGPGLSTVTSVTMLAAGATAGTFIAIGYFTTLAPELGPIGIIIAVVLIIWITILAIFGVGEIRKVEVMFKCEPWEPPANVPGFACEACGTNDALSDGRNNFPCSEYSCEAIGQNCLFVGNSEIPERGGVCIGISQGDLSFPRLISVENISEGFRYHNFEPNKGFEVKKEGNTECLGQFERVTIGFSLDEFGDCAISAVDPLSARERLGPDADNTRLFESMGSIGGFGKEQSFVFRATDLDNFGLEDGLNLEERNDITIYLACEDYFGNNNADNPFEVGLCVVPEDLSAVQFLDIDGISQLLPYDLTETQFSVNLNEPADCRWDERDIPFSQMSQDRQCNAQSNPFIGDYSCTFRGVPISVSETNICVKCLDRPEWQGTDREGERHENAECLDVTFDRSQSALTAELVSPENGELIKFGRGNPSVEIVVEISGGADGTAECDYTIDGANGGLMGVRSGRQTQSLNRIGVGEHNLGITCRDGVNQDVSISSSFSVEQDSSVPQVTRIYRESGSLFIVTDEVAECAYTFAPVEGRNAACDFQVEEANSVGGVVLMRIVSDSEGFRHSTSFNDDKTYHIKCEDEFGNEPLGCNVVASSGDFTD